MLTLRSWILAEATITLVKTFSIVFFLNFYYTFITYDGPKGNEQRAESNDQRVKSNEQRAKSNKQRVTSEKFSLVYIAHEVYKSVDEGYQVKGVFRGGSRTAATSKIELFVIIVNGF